MSPLRERPFRILFTARTVSFLGTNLAPIAVAFGVLGIGGGAPAVGYAFAAWTLAQVSTLLLAGVVGDRLPRRRVMIASDTASCCVRTAMAVLLVSGHAEVWELVALQACGGAAVAFYSPASSGLVPQTVPSSLLQQANGYMNVARYAAFPLGAATGGTIVALVGAGWALALDAATYGASALLLTRLRLPAAVATARATNFVGELRDGWRAWTEHTWVWLLNVWISLYFLITYAPFFVLGPYVAKQSMGGAGAWAVVVTGEGVGALLGGVVALRYAPRRTWTVAMAIFALTSVQSVLLAVGAPVAPLAVAAALAGFAFSFGSVIFETGVQRQVAPDKLARVSAYGWFSAMAFLPLGYAIAGPLGMAIGIPTYLWIGAVWIVVSCFAVTRVRSVREFSLRAEMETPAPVLT